MDSETMVNDSEIQVQEEVVEEVIETGESLESVMDEKQPSAKEQPEAAPAPKQEPGYVKTRIAEALARERDNIRQELMAEFQPLRDQLIEMQARDLVKSGEFKSIERAKEYLQLKQGVTPAAPEQPARNEKGQFTAKSSTSEDLETQVRIKILRAQADKIKAAGGPDVIAEFNNNPEIRARVISGEIDFRDVADEMKQQTRRKPPAPTRSSNGASGTMPNAISQMTKEEFERMEKRIAEGARFELK